MAGVGCSPQGFDGGLNCWAVTGSAGNSPVTVHEASQSHCVQSSHSPRQNFAVSKHTIHPARHLCVREPYCSFAVISIYSMAC